MPTPLYYSHFRVLEQEDGQPWRLGVGSLGITYKAFDERSQQPVALTVISPSRLHDPAAQEQFLRLARAASNIRHPNVAAMVALDETPGNFFYAIEFMDGVTLEALLRERGRLPLGLALRLAAQIAHGLEAVHLQGSLHRDLRPTNIMLVPDGPERWHAKIFNFAQARAPETEGSTTATVSLSSSLRASVPYASPELCLGRGEPDGRSDLYSLGCVLWEMLAGQPPFCPATQHETVAQHVSAPLPLSQIARQPPGVRRLLEQLLAKDPADRPENGAAVARILEDELAQPSAEPAPSPRPTPEDGFGIDGLPARKSIAVLPFAVQGGTNEQQFFADGLTEELLNALAKVPTLRVVSRVSAFNFRGSALPLPEIAQRLGVTYLVDGWVRFAGPQARVDAHLAHGSDGFQIWAETYEREVQDMLAVQDEIAQAVARVLELKLAPRSAAPPSPEAYRFFLEGRAAWRQRTPVSLDHAQVCLERALMLEPRFARALVALADVPLARVDLAIIGHQPASAFVPVIREAMEKARAAIELEPDLAEAHASLGLAHRFLGERSSAIHCYRHAIALNPNYAPVHQWLARALTADGRIDEALEQSATGVMLDPLAPRIVDNHALLSLLAGRVADALEAVERGLATAPEDVQLRTWRIWALTALGRSHEVLLEARAILAQPRTGYYHIALRALLASGQRVEAEASAAAIPSASVLARCRAALLLGNNAEALDLLDARFLPYISHDALLFDPMWDGLREEPKFKQVLAELDLTSAHVRAQAWRAAHPQAARASTLPVEPVTPLRTGTMKTGLTELDAPGVPPPARLRGWEVAALVVVLLAVGAVTVAAIAFRPGGAPAAVAAKGPRSLAVLAFTHRGDDPQGNATAERVGDGLHAALNRNVTLQVAARAEAVRDRQAAPVDVGRRLGVAYVVEGSIRQMGERVRIAAQLINVSDGFTLWSETFDRDAREIGEVQEAIAAEVVKRMR